MKKYSPISCTFHDYIEHFITLRQEVKIVFIVDNEEIEIEDRILETYTSQTKEEFMKLEKYPDEIRLDNIISIDKYILKEFEYE